MCLVNFQYSQHPVYSLIVAANRDEFYDRPTAPAHFWSDFPLVLAGRDLLQMGTWLGISKNGRFAALTNYRDPTQKDGKYSRGNIVKDFLISNERPSDYIDQLSKNHDSYGGFNILLANDQQFFHYNNMLDEKNEIPPGTHSLSNHTLNTPWPKAQRGKKELNEYLQTHPSHVCPKEIFNILANEEVAEDQFLPSTGVDLELERALSPLFIKTPHYGTRSSTVLMVDREKNVQFIERSYRNGRFLSECQYTFKIK